jgi:hypothetical protein
VIALSITAILILSSLLFNMILKLDRAAKSVFIIKQNLLPTSYQARQIGLSIERETGKVDIHARRKGLLEQFWIDISSGKWE